MIFKLLNLFTDSSPHDYKSSLTSVYTASPVDESTVWQELLPLDMRSLNTTMIFFINFPVVCEAMWASWNSNIPGA